MKALLFLTAMSGVMMTDAPKGPETIDPSWNWNDVGMIATSADIFLPNQAQIIFKDDKILYLPQTTLSMKKTKKGAKSVFLVLDKSKLIEDSAKADFAKIDLGTTNDVINDGATLLKNLRELGVKLPNQAKIHTPMTLEQLKEATTVTDAEKSTAPSTILPSYLIARSFENKVNFSDRVVLFQTGHRTTIAKHYASLMTDEKIPADDKTEKKATLNEKKVFEAIMDKVVLKVDTYLSASTDGQAAKPEDRRGKIFAQVEPLFVLKPKVEPDTKPVPAVLPKDAKDMKEVPKKDKLDVSGGVLLYSVNPEKPGTKENPNPKTLKGIVAKTFTTDTKENTIQVNAECFLNQIVVATMRTDKKPKLKLPTLDEKMPPAGFALVDKVWHVSLKIPTGALPEAKEGAAQIDPSAVKLEWEDPDGEEYPTVVSRGTDSTPPVTLETELTLYDQECKEVYKGPISKIPARDPKLPMELKKDATPMGDKK